MPRKLRVAKVQVGVLPSPSWTFWLLTGRMPEGGIRLPDWPWTGMLWRPETGTPGPEAIIEQHRDALVEEAREAGFEPWFETGKKPRGAAVTTWAKAFCDRHAY